MIISTIIHPKMGEQTNEQKNISDALGWLSYMKHFHDVEVLKIEENGREIVDYNIPKW